MASEATKTARREATPATRKDYEAQAEQARREIEAAKTELDRLTARIEAIGPAVLTEDPEALRERDRLVEAAVRADLRHRGALAALRVAEADIAELEAEEVERERQQARERVAELGRKRADLLAEAERHYEALMSKLGEVERVGHEQHDAARRAGGVLALNASASQAAFTATGWLWQKLTPRPRAGG